MSPKLVVPFFIILICFQVEALSTTNNRIKRSVDLLPPPDKCGLQGTIIRVYGGKDCSINEYPSMALLKFTDGSVCGGSLINNRYVLSAAHCVSLFAQKKYGNLTEVVLGEHDTSTDPDCVEYKIFKKKKCAPKIVSVGYDEIIIHGDYQRKKRLNDIAMVRLNQEIEYTESVKPVCLPSKELRTEIGEQLEVVGWGRVNETSLAQIKQKLPVPVVSTEECQVKFKEYKTVLNDNTQLCAGGNAGQDSCGGDSGGPLFKLISDQFYLEGLVSFGPKECGTDEVPGVYTRVSAHIDWILSNLKP